MDASSLLMLMVFGGATFGAAATAAIFRPGEWYRRLNKPLWRPPDWLFAPVWTALYAMIALSGWLVWREGGLAGAALPLGIYALQLLLNAAWTPIFFGLRPARPGDDRDCDALGRDPGHDRAFSWRESSRGLAARPIHRLRPQFLDMAAQQHAFAGRAP